MIRNYLIVAWRNFRRHGVFSLINMASLAVGISSALVIYLIVSYEFSFDKFHKEGDQIYRVVTNMHFPDADFKNSGVPGPLPPAMKSSITGIEKSSVFWQSDGLDVVINQGDEKSKKIKGQDKII